MVLNQNPKIEELTSLSEFTLADLVNKWIGEAQEVRSLQETLSREDVPLDLLPIVDLWADSGPDCIGTVSHPSRMSAINMVGRVRFAEFIAQFDDEFNLRLRFPALDTISTETNGVTNPFSVSNILRINEKVIPKDIFDLCSPIWSSEVACEKFAVALLDSLSVEIDQFISIQKNTLNRGKNIRRRIRKEVSDRIERLHELSFHSVNQCASHHLNNLQNAIFTDLFPEINLFTGPLNSEDLEWMSLVRTTSAMLFSARGEQLFVDLCPEWKVIAVSGHNPNWGLTRVADKMVVLDMTTLEVVESEPDLAEFLSRAFPLAGLEILCQTAGLKTLQVGSEHGWRELAIKALKLDGKVAQIAERLPIGSEGEHVHKVMTIRGLPNFHIPLPLLFVALSNFQLRQFILSGSNRLSTIEFTPAEFRQFLAFSLVDASLIKENE